MEVAGRATQSGHNTLALNVSEANGKILTHELGHAKLWLMHPGGPTVINAAGSINNGQFGIDDLNNFIHGKADEIINFNVRRHQFHLIN